MVATATPSALIATENQHGARNYEPLPAVMARGKGTWLWDEHGRHYLDMLSEREVCLPATIAMGAPRR